MAPKRPKKEDSTRVVLPVVVKIGRGAGMPRNTPEPESKR
jgi:hypothetical protein